MRVISQCGKYDLPYERCVVWRNKEKIYACPIGEPESDYQVASYSTERKAERAMEMLHEVYVVHENYKKMSGELQLEAAKIVGLEKAFMYGGIFRFPQEDEIK